MLFPEDEHIYCQKFASEISSYFNNEREEEDKKRIDDLSYIDDQFFSFLQLQRRSEPPKKSETEPDDQFFSFLQLQRRSEVPSCEKIPSGVITRSKTKIPESKDAKSVTGAKRKISDKKPRKKCDSLNISDVWLTSEKDERNHIKTELWNYELPELDAYLGDDETYDSPYVPYFDEFPNFDILEQDEPELKRKVAPSSLTVGKWKSVETGGGKFRSLTPTESKCRSPLFEPSATTVTVKKRKIKDFSTANRKSLRNKHLAKQRLRTDEPAAPAPHHKQGLSISDDFYLSCPFQCEMCRFFCNTAEDLKNHWRSTVHSVGSESDSFFVCFACGLRLNSSDDVIRHLGTKKHESGVSVVIKRRVIVRCEICLKDLGLRVRLAKHMKLVHNQQNDSPSVPCSSCEWVGFSLKGLQVHVRRAHGNFWNFCTSCDQDFPNAREALQHRNSVKHRHFCNIQEPPTPVSMCQKCGSQFSNSQFLSYHTRVGCEFRMKRDNKMKYQCSECCFGCVKKTDLVGHKLHHREASKELVVCPEPGCPKTLLKKGLKEHFQSHTLEYSYRCSVCSKGFTRHARFLSHVAKHQNDGKVGKLHKCKDCKYSTAFSSHFKRHQLSHKEIRNYHCPHCNFKGKILEHLKRHLKTHLGTKPYKCPYCDYSCSLLENLRKHVVKTKTHKGRNLYECPWCTFGSSLGKPFDDHLKESHKEAYESRGKFQDWDIYRPRM